VVERRKFTLSLLMPMTDHLAIAVIQTDLSGSRQENVAKVKELVRLSASKGARVILPSELFAGIYFCQQERDEYFAWAEPASPNTLVQEFQELADQLNVVLPISFFEKAGQCYYNSVAVIDSNGQVLGIYRKSHIPDGPGYEEKFYFRPGNTGFKVWQTKFGRLGIGICWDQWFPECARAMVLMGADILLYPTAIGSEPSDPNLDTSRLWRRAMVGHAVCNVVPVAAANRIGTERTQFFYGYSFICDHRGDIVAEFGSTQEGVLTAEFDLDLIARHRASFGFFRDRRPELYGILTAE
jgi:N-carbamoylputrescine amidase